MMYAIVGGDERMNSLARLLRQRGDRAVLCPLGELPPQAHRVVTQCPPRGRDALPLEALLRRMRPDSRAYLCGPGHPEGLSAAWDVVDLFQDEALLRQNASLTAEGALSAAMRAGRRSLRGMPCLVVGWGRIGRALTELLVGLGARPTVASRSESSCRRAVERGAQAVATEALPRALRGCALVFNTAPAMVLDAEALKCAERDAMIIDLASPPYGVDLRAAWRMGLRAWREPALPGRYCPDSAAQALLEAMDRGEAARRG